MQRSDFSYLQNYIYIQRTNLYLNECRGLYTLAWKEYQHDTSTVTRGMKRNQITGGVAVVRHQSTPYPAYPAPITRASET